MDSFGENNPREMPSFLFYRSVKVAFDTAVRADPGRQNCSICPRYWYLDLTFRCERCGAEFVFSAAEQRVWYEEYGFWIDSLPRHCLTCRRDRRHLTALRREYDRTVGATLDHGTLESRRRLAAVIDQLYEYGGDLPTRINESRRRLARQIASAEREAG